MLPYSRGLILDNTPNYGIMKTEAVFGFAPNNNKNESFNTTEPLEWILTNGSFQTRSLQVTENNTSDTNALTKRDPKALKQKPPKKSTKKISKEKKIKKIKINKAKGKSKNRQSKKVNKCIIKFLKKGGQGQQSQEAFSGKKRKRNRGNRFQKMQKKYMMPVILGLLAAKSILIPIALKALAFMSAKGLMMAFFSTVMASVISLKGMFNHPHEYHNRKDDAKTQVEIIQVPTKSEDHVFYDDHHDHHYKRGDLIPVLAPADIDHLMIPNNHLFMQNGDHVVNKKGKFGKQKRSVNKR